MGERTPDAGGYLEFLKPLKRIADELGLICNQVHGSFVPKKYGDEEYNTATFARIVREMEAAAFMGAPVIVIHALKTLALLSEVSTFASVKPQKKL